MTDSRVRTLALFNSHQVALISAQDYPRCSHYVWSLARGRVIATCTTSGRKVGVIQLARLVTRAPKGVLIDHKNNDPRDCRRENLRPASSSQNARNRVKSARKSRVRPLSGASSSQYKGVSVHPRRESYLAHITVDGHRVSLGRFTHEEEAARAYDRAAMRYFGAFAKLNFPGEKTR